MSLQDVLSHLGSTRLVAVSKLQPAAKIRALYNQGQRDFGENYVQEALEKQELLADLPDICWHLIGHLQKNKARQVVGQFALIHSVDSLDLARVLSRQCEKKNIRQDILLQVNLAEEDTKHGFNKAHLLSQWSELAQLPHLRLCGLMTMPPLVEDPEELRPYFAQLRELRDELRQNAATGPHPMTELSMGTSLDHKVAVEEGSTLVRLGTILFGERAAKR